MLVHFVCQGNRFRSRMAEAYLASLQLPHITVSSSGTRADRAKENLSLPARAVLSVHHILSHASHAKHVTNQDLLDKADIVICMNRKVYQDCNKQGLKLPSQTYIWNVSDIDRLSAEEQQSLEDGAIPREIAAIFRNIVGHIDELTNFLRRPHVTDPIDILNADGTPTGEQTDITTAHQNGLWHGGAHLALYTSSKRVVLSRRSETIISNPGLWEMSLGGVIGQNESAEVAILREAYEELGIRLSASQLKKLPTRRYSHYLPHYGFHNRVVLYTFIAEIPANTTFTLQASEVAEAIYSPIQEVRQILSAHHPSKRLVPLPAYHRSILAALTE